jgi:hypothetical protein
MSPKSTNSTMTATASATQATVELAFVSAAAGVHWATGPGGGCPGASGDPAGATGGAGIGTGGAGIDSGGAGMRSGSGCDSSMSIPYDGRPALV